MNIKVLKLSRINSKTENGLMEYFDIKLMVFDFQLKNMNLIFNL